jgi:hypothetical protein
MFNKKYLSLVFFMITASTIVLPKTITLFSHGIADTFKQAYLYSKKSLLNNEFVINTRYLFTTPFFTFNYPDALECLQRGNYKETSFGQENEIARLNSAYKKACKETHKKHDACEVILFGLSRGASNIVIFVGTHIVDNVKAIILESPYSMMGDVIESILHKFNVGWIPLSYGEYLAELIFRKYKHNGMRPGDFIENIPHDIPLLIICSKEDHLVPFTSSINLYKKLVANGHKNAYLFVAEHGRHAKILQGPDGEKYQVIVHAFYKKYNLPHDPSIAAKGEQLLLLCQPVV